LQPTLRVSWMMPLGVSLQISDVVIVVLQVFEDFDPNCSFVGIFILKSTDEAS